MELKTYLNKILHGDSLELLKTLPDESVDCCVTSPPYWGLRDYGVNGQLGSEKSPELFVAAMVQIFREVFRVLKDEGTLWLNIGDSYAAGPKQRTPAQACRKSSLKGSVDGQIACKDQLNKITGGLKAKDLVGIPWMLAFALRSEGWYLRQDIIWHKPNPMPESVTDRCTKSHEYIFLFSKSNKYYFDQFSIATDYKDKTLTTFGIESKGHGDGSGLIASENWARDVKVRKPKDWGKTLSAWQTGPGSHSTTNHNSDKGRKEERKRRFDDSDKIGLNGNGLHNHSGNYDANRKIIGTGKANKRSVWSVSSVPFKEAHFATFPEDLIVDCIKAGCPQDGIVLDPFMGAGTTALVARKLNRNFIGIELNPNYIKIANKRLKKELGMFQ